MLVQPSVPLLQDVRVSLGITSDSRDGEIIMLIQAAKEHLKARGLLTGSEEDWEILGLRRTAIVAFVKSNFGLDNAEMDKINAMFTRIVCDLMNTDLVNETTEEIPAIEGV